MGLNNNHRDFGNKNPSSPVTRGPRSWGTTASGQSVSTSGSVGSPSIRSEAKLNRLNLHADDAQSQGPAGVRESGKQGKNYL